MEIMTHTHSSVEALGGHTEQFRRAGCVADDARKGTGAGLYSVIWNVVSDEGFVVKKSDRLCVVSNVNDTKRECARSD